MTLLDDEDDDEDFVLDWDELMGTNYEELAIGGAENAQQTLLEGPMGSADILACWLQ